MYAKYAHCDQNVCHEPKLCIYCDLYPEAQQARIDSKTNFTGQNFDGLAPCPSDKARGIGGAHVWGPNRPSFYNDAVFTDLETSWFDELEDP